MFSSPSNPTFHYPNATKYSMVHISIRVVHGRNIRQARPTCLNQSKKLQELPNFFNMLYNWHTLNLEDTEENLYDDRDVSSDNEGKRPAIKGHLEEDKT